MDNYALTSSSILRQATVGVVILTDPPLSLFAYIGYGLCKQLIIERKIREKITRNFNKNLNDTRINTVLDSADWSCRIVDLSILCSEFSSKIFM